ncbi:MAG: glycosyltransferase [candidate division KSB1 bacterium]|nr:glycosyltransferase [candidate division KSB1 bacterium]MDZ7366677.1 glycosyltransferase [candidate division KSB1 bacterium]MDZ7404687.1 glycosyltransferase [candidate division KSB1 bacterium]
MSRLKILVIASWYPNETAPANGIFIQDQAQVLAQKYDVAVLAPRMVGWREILRGKFGGASQLEPADGLLVCRERVLAPMPRAPGLTYRRWLAAAQKGFSKLLTQWGKPDLIHAHVVLPGGLAAVRLGRQQAIPVVLTEHTSPFSVHLKTATLRRWVRETLSQANRVIAVSPALARQIHAFDDGVKIDVIGNVIQTDFFIPAQTATRTPARFLSIGLLTKQKGMRYLLQAAKQLVQNGVTAFELIIGGDGPERPQLERLARSLSLAERCRFTGMLTREQVKNLMQQSDALVMSSLHETFCLVLAEAMACGKPVIATRCGGPEFLVTSETGVLVEVANPEALAAAMADFIHGRFQYDAQKIRRHLVERFGEAVFLRHIDAIYEQVFSQAKDA